jgi:MioC protein
MSIDRYIPWIKKDYSIKIGYINLLYRKFKNLGLYSQNLYSQNDNQNLGNRKLYRQVVHGLLHKLKDELHALKMKSTIVTATEAARTLADTDLVYSSDNSTVVALNKKRKSRVHDYTPYQHGIDYVFETIDGNEEKGYMTGQGKRIKPGDYIVLQQGSVVEQYLIERIDYYSNPSDIWIALLSKTR